MTITVFSARQTHRFVPAGQDDVPEDKRRAYLVATPTRLTFNLMRAHYMRLVETAGEELGVAKAKPVERKDIFNALLDRVAALDFTASRENGDALTKHDLLDALDRHSAGTASADDTALVEELERAVLRADPSYAALCDMHAASNDALLMALMQRFVTGWENVNVGFAQEHGLVPASLVNRLPPGDAIQVAAFALRLGAPGDAAAKNSDSRPSLPSNPSNGGTAASTTRETPETPETPGSSTSPDSISISN